MENRRKFPRVNTAKMMVSWRKVKAYDNLNETKDISGGGICLMVDGEGLVSVGDILQLEFSLPLGKTIYSKGKAVWLDKFTIIGDLKEETRYEVGVEFLDINDKDRAAIEQFVFLHLPLNKKTTQQI
ncbi:MAG: PilZ domain-containing protein [Candidatus Omnitrophota bacterium]